MGGISFHFPAQTGKLLLRNIQIVETTASSIFQGRATLHLTAPIMLVDPSQVRMKFVDLISDLSKTVLYSQVFSQSTFVTGAAVVPTAFWVIHRTDDQPIGWAALDVGEGLGGPDKMFAIVLSENTHDAKWDGFNVMFLREETRRASGNAEGQFVRLGVGEIVDKRWIENSETRSITIV